MRNESKNKLKKLYRNIEPLTIKDLPTLPKELRKLFLAELNIKNKVMKTQTNEIATLRTEIKNFLKTAKLKDETFVSARDISLK